MLLSDNEKNIYNNYLAALKASQNKPFKPRKNFDNLREAQYRCLKKLHSFFSQNNSVKYYDFFIAPYKCYSDITYLDLDFFITYKAIKCYTTYVKAKQLQDPDSINSINDCKESCSFVYKFCAENSLTLEEYLSGGIGPVPYVLQHLKENKINFYVMHGFGADKGLSNIDNEIINFMFSNFNKTLNETRINFVKSVKLKKLFRQAVPIIQKKLLINKLDNISS